jgi:hypothetical protein
MITPNTWGWQRSLPLLGPGAACSFFLALIFLGLEGGAKPKLIIIIIIDFTLQIKSILMNLIKFIIVIIILKLFGSSFYNF